MSLETPIEYGYNIKCPVCRHKFLYDFKIQDINKIKSKEKSDGCEIEYEFETFLICKNPLCNYDIELKGNIYEYPINKLKSLEIRSIK